MTGSDSAHDSHDAHAVHPVPASLVVLALAALFGLIFSLAEKGWTAPVITVVAILAVWGLVNIWVLDKE